jgi:hypothetical protein
MWINMDRYVDKQGQICGVVMDCGVLTCSVISWWECQKYAEIEKNSTLGIRIDHKILESIIGSDAYIRPISRFSDDRCSTNINYILTWRATFALKTIEGSK